MKRMLLIAFFCFTATAANSPGSEFTVERRDFVKHLTFTGDLQAANSVIIPVPRTSSDYRFVVSYLAPEGRFVQADDLLVEFDVSDLETGRLRLEKEKEDARIKIAQKESELEARRQDLLLNKATAEKNLKTAELYVNIAPQLIARVDAEKYQFDYSKSEIELEKAQERLATHEESGRSELQVARLEYESANRQLERLLSELKRMRIRAPMPGLVIHAPARIRAGKVQVGDQLYSGWPVILLPNMNEVRIQAFVYDADFPLLREGMPAGIVFDVLPEKTFRGRVDRLPDVAKPRQYRSQLKAFRVDILLLEKDLELMKPGMTARVRVPVIREQALVVPRAALHFNSDGAICVKKKEPPSQMIPVQALDANGEQVMVEGDLKEGEKLLPLISSFAERGTAGFKWLPIRKQDLLFTVSGTGTVKAQESVDIGPPPHQHHWQFKIVRMVAEGAEVQKGDFLIAFDPSEAHKRLREERANLQKVREQYGRTETSRTLQIKDLELQLEEARVQQEKSENKLIKTREFESIIQVREAQYEVELNRKRVELLEKKQESVRRQIALQLRILEDTENLHKHRVEISRRLIKALTIRAPSSGVVIYQTNWRNEKKQVGSQVRRLEKVLSLPDLTTMMVNGQVAEVDAGKVRIGQPVTVNLDAIPEKTYTGRIVEIGTIFRLVSYDRPVKVLDIKVALDQIDIKRMGPGMAARLRIIVDEFRDVLAVPLSVIQMEDGKSFVWVKGEDGPAKRKVEIGQDNGIAAVVRAGLREGEEIASKPLDETK